MPKQATSVKLATVTTVLLLSSMSSFAFAGTIPPVTTATISPSSPDGDNNWYVTPVRIDLTSTDLNSGVKELNYKIDDGNWQTVSFSDTLNLVQNPSMESAGATSSGIQGWEATTQDAQTTYSQDPVIYAPNFASSSAKIVTTDGSGTWHGINNASGFAVAYAYENMTASAWIKTQDVTGSAYFKIYSLSDDGFGGTITTLLTTSSAVSGTTDWTFISKGFSALPESVTGIYIDIGFTGSGTAWIDAVTINSSAQEAQTSITIAEDRENHTFEYYAVDTANNVEGHSCIAPKVNCLEFDLDTTPPGNWSESGAIRSTDLGSNDHTLWVFTNVEDATSGLSSETSEFQYKIDTEEFFGRFTDLLACNTPWQIGAYAPMTNYPQNDGDKTAYLQTEKTDFCDSDWKVCKIVKFFAKDMAGNTSEKNFCINGPWIRIRGEGVVRSNSWIDMVAEPEGDNTDGLIEISNSTIDFFTSTRDWKVRNSPTPIMYSYDDYWNLTDVSKTQITGNLSTQNGIFYYNGEYHVTNQKIPNGYNSNTFSQVVFINGDLYIEDPIEVGSTGAALFVVKGDVFIQKKVNDIGIGIIADGDIYTAYDINEGESTNTLDLRGILQGNNVMFQRTLQGTNNEDTPSEDLIYEPKYLLKLRDYFGRNKVHWISVE